MVNILDAEHGTALRKSIYLRSNKPSKAKVVSLERACMLFVITREAIYQRESRAKSRAIELAPVKAVVLEVRRFMPRLAGRKLYFLLKPKFIE